MPVQPRRTFAPSFVLTVVGSVAVASAQPEPPTKTAPPPISKNPPAPPRKVPPKKDPPKKDPPKKVDPPKAPTTDRHFHYMMMDKKCVAHDADACKVPAGQPAPPCNPPAPQPVACPVNLTLPVMVIQSAGSTECYVDWGPNNCPPGLSCNPPAPRKVACPGT